MLPRIQLIWAKLICNFEAREIYTILYSVTVENSYLSLG